jgi:hypothetical protein
MQKSTTGPFTHFSDKRHSATKSAACRNWSAGVNRQVAFALLWPKGATATWVLEPWHSLAGWRSRPQHQ